MNRVSVITGGAGGMGLATAKIVGRDHTVVLCDVRQDRLAAAAAALQDLGITPTVVDCDVTDRRAVTDLLVANGAPPQILRFGLPDAFPAHYGTQNDHLEINGLLPQQMSARIMSVLEKGPQALKGTTPPHESRGDAH